MSGPIDGAPSEDGGHGQHEADMKGQHHRDLGDAEFLIGR